MNTSEYEQLKAQAEEDYRRNLAAIDRVFQLSSSLAAPNLSTSLRSELPENNGADAATRIRRPVHGRARGSVIGAARQLVKEQAGAYTARDILNLLTTMRVQAKHGSIKAILKQFTDEGIVEIVSHGVGRKGSKYRTIKK